MFTASQGAVVESIPTLCISKVYTIPGTATIRKSLYKAGSLLVHLPRDRFSAEKGVPDVHI